ncbi:MAG: DUF4239 domain-containing protein [Actinobacteria bacterium]|nr:DUF4239 domain-containing protein [Actinomycetota bacterium]
MIWLTSMSTLWILAAAVLLVSVAGVAATVLLGRLPARVRDAIAGASVSGAAGLFAILTGFLIAQEYGTLREMQRTVANEAAAMSSLAYTSAVFPPADATLLQDRLARYGEAVTASEWPALAGENPDSEAFDRLADLQQDVARIGNRDYAPGQAADELSKSATAITVARGHRLAIAEQELPVPLFVLALLSGIAFIVEALLVAARHGRRYSTVAAGVIVLVGLDLGAVLAVSAPFRGAFTVSPRPIADVAADLRAGEYLSWVRATTDQAVDQGCDPTAADCVRIGPDDPIIIGSLLSARRPTGQDSAAAIELAVDYLDGTFDGIDGTLLGRSVVLLERDDGCSAATTTTAQQQLIAERQLLGVIGTTCSTAALDVADKAFSAAKIPLISPSNTAPSLTDPNRHEPYYFRVAWNDVVQGTVTANFATSRGWTTVTAVALEGESYSTQLATVFAETIRRRGGTATVITRPAGETDAALAARIAATGPQLVFLPVVSPSCEPIARAVRDRPTLRELPLLVGEACSEPTLLTALGADLGELYASGPDFSFYDDNEFYATAFLDAYRRNTGRDPITDFHAHAFDATQLLFDAIRRSAVPTADGGLLIDRAQVRTELLRVSGYPGISGVLGCTLEGDCAQNVRMAVYRAPDLPSVNRDAPAKVFGQARGLGPRTGG